MNWDATGVIAEVIGAIAVVISLLYLAWELRENTRVMRADSSRDTQLGWATFNENLSSSSDRMVLAKLFDPSITASQLSVEEQHTLFFYQRALLLRFESELFQYKAGLLTPETWENNRHWCAGFIRLPIISEWWASERDQPVYTTSFKESLESVDIYDKDPSLLSTLARPRMDAPARQS